MDNVSLAYMDDMLHVFKNKDEIKAWLESKKCQKVWEDHNLYLNHSKCSIIEMG